MLNVFSLLTVLSVFPLLTVLSVFPLLYGIRDNIHGHAQLFIQHLLVSG